MLGAIAMAMTGLAVLARKRSMWLEIHSTLRREAPECYLQICDSLQIIHTAFNSSDSSRLALAFNGGKDCLVVFYLVWAYCQHHQLPMPLVVYFEKDQDEFPQMIQFRQSFLLERNVPLRTVSGDYKQGLQELQQVNITSIFMGTRSTDPYAPATAFAPTTAGWPEMTRVSPVLQLDYANVWLFLRTLQLPYCCLYDEGFSSLGPKSTTQKNSSLVDQRSGHALPAHELKPGHSERGGRVSSAS